MHPVSICILCIPRVYWEEPSNQTALGHREHIARPDYWRPYCYDKNTSGWVRRDEENSNKNVIEDAQTMKDHGLRKRIWGWLITGCTFFKDKVTSGNLYRINGQEQCSCLEYNEGTGKREMCRLLTHYIGRWHEFLRVKRNTRRLDDTLNHTALLESRNTWLLEAATCLRSWDQPT
ncbi:hypothetical protein CSKR_111133 [Clonorchis sinensis]|uniref:Uncharacterized protein n=1 Tax=Clonorchis sinensis TaxID=79923 RepID=A0A3R7JUF8_CLOSI|nr:hypothetical protein CSKR_111133 [Clonorchis sinensis]